MSADAAELERLAAHARAAGRIALDTEFMGEGRYRTLLCLIQVAVPLPGGGQEVALIDPLEDGAANPGFAAAAGPLAGLLADPEVRVIVHAGRQDVALLRRELGTEATGLFDTQLAAGFTGLAAQRSYAALLSTVLGVELAKSASFTRWDARPLSEEQLAYAREDVLHMLDLAAELERRLDELGRLRWALEECEPLAASSDARSPEIAFERLPRVGAAGPTARAIALELVRWRERVAERRDRPVQSVLSDQALMEIARRAPSTTQALSRIRGLPPQVARRSSQEIVAAVRRGRQAPPPPRAPRTASRPPDGEQAPIVALAEAVAKARAHEAGLAYELLASRADLQALVTAFRAGDQAPDAGEPSSSTERILTGWRREIVGEQLLALLRGELTLKVRNGSLHIH